MRKTLLFIAATGLAVPAAAQLPGLVRRAPPAPAQTPIEALRADFSAQSGGTIVYFSLGSSVLSQQARTRLAAQALWLRQHPEVAVRIEGRGDPADTRSHALALGARRAEEVRAYLLLLGAPAAQVSTMSWGKERPGPPSAATAIVQ